MLFGIAHGGCGCFPDGAILAAEAQAQAKIPLQRMGVGAGFDV
jgi:hypothetical protein